MSGWRSWMSALERRHRARSAGGDGPSQNGRARRRTEKPLSASTLLMMLAVIAAAALLVESNVFADVQRARHGVEADGTVVGKWTGKGATRYADVVFTTPEGRRVRASVVQDDWRRMPEVGDRVRVRYLPADPAGSAVDARDGALGSVRPALFGLVAVLLGIWMYRLHRRSRSLGEGGGTP